MPRKRSAVGTTLTFQELTLNEKLALSVRGWRPGDHRTPRFSTWTEYFATYRQVRSEMLAARGNKWWPPFAELALGYFAAGGDPLDASEEYERAIAARRPMVAR